MKGKKKMIGLVLTLLAAAVSYFYPLAEPVVEKTKDQIMQQIPEDAPETPAR